MTYTQPSARTMSKWTVPGVRMALKSADSGYLQTAARLCDSLFGDDRVASSFETRIGGLLGLPTYFEAATGRRDARMLSALEEDWWLMYPEHELNKLMRWGRGLGVGYGQLVPVERNGRLIPQLETWEPFHLRYDFSRQQWLTKVGGQSEEVVVTPGDGWVMYMPYGTHRPWAHGLWRGLAWWFLLKWQARDDWGHHSEVAARLFVSSENRETRKEQRKSLSDEILGSAKDAIITLPKGFVPHLIELTANTRDIYEAQIDCANKGIAIGIQGVNLTSEVNGGSFAAAQVHAKVERQRIRSDEQTTTTTLREQGTRVWAQWNFANAERAPWGRYDTTPPEDAKERANVFEAVCRGLRATSKSDYEPDLGEVEEEFGFTFKRRELEDPPELPAPNNRARRQHRLASGDSPDEAPGFVASSVYADELVEAGVVSGSEAFAPHLDGALQLIEQLDEPDIQVLADALVTPDALATDIEQAILLAHLRGQVGVLEDIEAAA